jgi:hypothetical protein
MGRKRRKAKKPSQGGASGESTSTEFYKYERLPSKDSIRILELLPSPEGQIYCALKTVSLSENPTYDALSYSWANPVTIREEPIRHDDNGQMTHEPVLGMMYRLKMSTCEETINVDSTAMTFFKAHPYLPYMDREHGRTRSNMIVCDGKTISVTQSLFDALLQLRRLIMRKLDAESQGLRYYETLPVSRSKHLWIDAICINQDDVDEKSLQVPLMNKIYASAQYVFAWIGELDGLGASGLDAILNLGQRHRSGFQPPQESGAWSKAWMEDRSKLLKNLYALTALLSRLWFRRAWCVQEAVFAKRLYIWSGPFFMDWWHLLPAVRAIEENKIELIVNLTASLIRREPTARLGKMLAGIERKRRGEETPMPVTKQEVLDNLTGAIAFLNGVLESKKLLGLPWYRFDLPNTDDISSEALAGALWLPNAPESLLNHLIGSKVEDNKAGPLPSSEIKRESFIVESLSQPFLDSRLEQKQSKYDSAVRGARFSSAFRNHNFRLAEATAPTPVSLFSLITGFRNVGASDPRDKIFAFLHMATEIPDLKPNYRASTQFVYERTAELIMGPSNLALLSHVQDLSDTKIKDMPSWVPDFSVPLGRKPLVADETTCPYAACGEDSPSLCFYLTVESKGKLSKVLSLGGYKLDTVAEVAESNGCYFTRVGSIALNTPKLYSKANDVIYNAKSGLFMRLGVGNTKDHDAWRKEPLKVPRAEALWRTMIADSCYDVYPAPVAAGFGFSDWVATHVHHGGHFLDMLADHFAAVTEEKAHEDLRMFSTHQERKLRTYLSLRDDEIGHYTCYECSLENFEEDTVDHEVLTAWRKAGYEAQMHPTRYLPDGYRMILLEECIFKNIKLAKNPDTANCPVLSPAVRKRRDTFEERMRDVKTGRKMFRTNTDLLGMGPKSVQPGDEVWVVLGAKVPFALRPVEGGKAPLRYTLVGEAYVHGYMNGEILREKRKYQQFGLV